MFSTPSERPLSQLPYVTVRRRARGGAAVYYRRRLTPDQRAILGTATINFRLAGDPDGSPAERRRFLAAYARADGQAEHRLSAITQRRVLTPQETLGLAGSALRGEPQHPDTADRREAEALFLALRRLDVVLPVPLPPDWQLPSVGDNRAVDAAERLAWMLDGLPHAGETGPIPGDLLFGDRLQDPAAAAEFITTTVRQCAPVLSAWIRRAQAQLNRLGLVVSPEQRQAVALRLAAVAAALGDEAAAIEQGRVPPPVTFPDPPAPELRSCSFAAALDRWRTLKSPAPRSAIDAERRMAELAAVAGHDRLDQLTAEQIVQWRDGLLRPAAGKKPKSAATARKHLGLIRAIAQAAAADGMTVDPAVLARLSGSTISQGKGTTIQRRPFTRDESAALIAISRKQSGRDLDRWAFPLGLALGCRLEEIAGLRRTDVEQIDGIWVVQIRPSAETRLKSDSSCRAVPIPQVLQTEGFVDWALGQPSGFLFDEPTPPATDPRRSHYASIRLGKILRNQAGISDSSAVFHSCRHTVAQSLIDAGSEQRLVEQILGHSSRSMTARYSKAGLPLEQLHAAQEQRYWRWWTDLHS